MRTNTTLRPTWFAPRNAGSGVFRDVYTVMNDWGANHCVMSYRHIGADIVSLDPILRCLVYMHNLEETDILRLNAWNFHGTADPESADFRACANDGTLYG